ncbi:MAG: hypothetical protein ABTS22_19690 [Accumulibacter sp.]|uniref:hypothetical protein n=1 Tax=Accumulibacter sp. TaxID=2053492 RepID=UPI0033152DC9
MSKRTGNRNGGWASGNSLWYNNHEEKTSERIQHGEVGQIMGLSTEEMNEYGSLEEVNNDCHGYSFTPGCDEPEYETLVEN